MIGRLTLLSVLLAALPLAVDLPSARDSSSAGRLQVEVAGGGGQFAILSRGCDGNVYRVTHNQLLSGALVVEQKLPRDFVIGVRAGNTRTTLRTGQSYLAGVPGYMARDSVLVERYANPYVNPYLGYEGRKAGIGAGWITTDRPLVLGEHDFIKPHMTGHVRVGGGQRRLTLRWMEDVPLESEGHLSVDVATRPTRSFEAAAFAGVLGPYDGAMLGLRGRVWFTPEAALQIKLATTGRNSEYGVYGGVTVRLPGEN